MKMLLKLNSLYLLISALILTIMLSSCQEEAEVAVGAPSEIAFALDAQTYDEGSGTVKVNVILDKPQNVRTVLNYRIEGNAISNLKSILQADFELITEPPLIIPKGETTAAIEFRIVEDEIFEADLESIVFKLDAVLEGNAALTEDLNRLTHTINIQENDYKLFLEWENTDNSNVDMNLYVELPNKKLLASEKSAGFEEVTIVNARDNEQYYVDVWLNEGDALVNYYLKCQKAGSTEQETLLNDHFVPGVNAGQEENRSELLKNYLLVRAGKDLKIL